MKERLLWFVPALALAAGFVGLRVFGPHLAPAADRILARFGLPTFPGGYEFKAFTGDPRSRSVAYLVKRPADDVATYYRREMSTRSFRLAQDTPVQFPVPAAGRGVAHRVPGRQLLFEDTPNNRAVVVMAVEQPVRGAHTQVAVAFGPMSALGATRGTSENAKAPPTLNR